MPGRWQTRPLGAGRSTGQGRGAAALLHPPGAQASHWLVQGHTGIIVCICPEQGTEAESEITISQDDRPAAGLAANSVLQSQSSVFSSFHLGNRCWWEGGSSIQGQSLRVPGRFIKSSCNPLDPAGAQHGVEKGFGKVMEGGRWRESWKSRKAGGLPWETPSHCHPGTQMSLLHTCGSKLASRLKEPCFGHTRGMWMFPGQRRNSGHSGGLSIIRKGVAGEMGHCGDRVPTDKSSPARARPPAISAEETRQHWPCHILHP